MFSTFSYKGELESLISSNKKIIRIVVITIADTEKLIRLIFFGIFSKCFFLKFN